jgi:hypothetical protein
MSVKKSKNYEKKQKIVRIRKKIHYIFFILTDFRSEKVDLKKKYANIHV